MNKNKIIALFAAIIVAVIMLILYSQVDDKSAFMSKCGEQGFSVEECEKEWVERG